MANGWAPDSAVQDQIEDSVKDAVSSARARIPTGESATHCLECGEPIPEKRRLALPGVRTCIACQAGCDARPAQAGIQPSGQQGQPASLRAAPF